MSEEQQATETAEAADVELLARIEGLDRKIDTIAGAMAAVARSQNDIVAKATESDEHRSQDVVDLAHRMESLERLVLGLTKSLEGADARTDDRFAALRDAATVPVNDLKELLVARTERTETRLQDLLDRLAEATAQMPGSSQTAAGAGDLSDERLSAIVGQLDALAERLDEIDVAGPVSASSQELGDHLADHTDAALAGLLRLVDDRVESLRGSIQELAEATGPAPANSAGFEAGAVMGAAQAAWNRLEQRLDNEFDDLGRQLQAMGSLIEQALATAEAAANRPVVTGESIRKTASSLKEALQTANRNRRDRRGGPHSLGPGS